MTKKQFKEKITKLAERLKVKPKEIQVRDMTNKWASCSTRGRLTFDYEILEMEEELQHYIIVHELIHLRIQNHGKLFKAVLRTHCPQYMKLEKELKIINHCKYN